MNFISFVNSVNSKMYISCDHHNFHVNQIIYDLIIDYLIYHYHFISIFQYKNFRLKNLSYFLVPKQP